VVAVLDEAEREIEALSPMKSEEALKRQLTGTLKIAREAIPETGNVTVDKLDGVLATLQGVKTESAPKGASSCRAMDERVRQSRR
jgi:hypothetical protein